MKKKKILQIPENPTLILKSQNKGDTSKTRFVIFGTVKKSGGNPVLSILDLTAVGCNLVLNDMQKLTSAYIKDEKTLTL